MTTCCIGYRDKSPAGHTKFFRIGVELLMTSLTGPRLSLKSLAMAGLEARRAGGWGPRPPTAWDVSVSSASIFSFGSTARLLLAASSAGPTSLGTELLVMVEPGARNWLESLAGTRSRYCSPMADTECTLAVVSTGILNWLSMLI